jgi:hypothetical protein
MGQTSFVQRSSSSFEKNRDQYGGKDCNTGDDHCRNYKPVRHKSNRFGLSRYFIVYPF